MSNVNHPALYVDVQTASEILGIKRTQTLAELGEPDDKFVTPSGRTKYLYLRCKVQQIKRLRECEKCLRQNKKHKRSCYHCRNYFAPQELTSGICADCQAKKLVKNFTHHGDCCKNPFDCERLKTLSRVLAEFQLQHSLS